MIVAGGLRETEGIVAGYSGARMRRRGSAICSYGHAPWNLQGYRAQIRSCEFEIDGRRFRRSMAENVADFLRGNGGPQQTDRSGVAERMRAESALTFDASGGDAVANEPVQTRSALKRSVRSVMQMKIVRASVVGRSLLEIVQDGVTRGGHQRQYRIGRRSWSGGSEHFACQSISSSRIDVISPARSP